MTIRILDGTINPSNATEGNYTMNEPLACEPYTDDRKSIIVLVGALGTAGLLFAHVYMIKMFCASFITNLQKRKRYDSGCLRHDLGIPRDLVVPERTGAQVGCISGSLASIAIIVASTHAIVSNDNCNDDYERMLACLAGMSIMLLTSISGIVLGRCVGFAVDSCNEPAREAQRINNNMYLHAYNQHRQTNTISEIRGSGVESQNMAEITGSKTQTRRVKDRKLAIY